MPDHDRPTVIVTGDPDDTDVQAATWPAASGCCADDGAPVSDAAGPGPSLPKETCV
jgi:hypothetical protein